MGSLAQPPARVRRSALVLLVVATIAASCTSGGRPAGQAPADPRVTGAGEEAVEAPEGIARVQGCEPNSLLPANMQSACEEQVVDALFSRLVELNDDGSTPRWGALTDHAVAARITSDDARTWTIEVEEGWEFHDGTEVTASSFVDAWNFAAFGPSAQAQAFLFEPIVGFDELHCPEAGCEPDSDELDGLRLVDDMTFEVELTAPDRFFPRRLAHVAFSPLPPDVMEDPGAWEESPVGNGPFRMDGAWQHDQLIALRAFEDYLGPPPRAEGVDVRLYNDGAAAWEALGEDRLDVLSSIPPGLRADARDELRAVRRAGSQLDVMVVPAYREGLADPRLALALSRAINRTAIVANRLEGLARPAPGLLPAVVTDAGDRCGDVCRFDPESARSLLREVGLPENGIEIWYDRDGDQGDWVPALANQWRRHLELEPEQVRLHGLQHAQWVAHVEGRRVRGVYPLGWRMDVASADEYLRELHAPNGLFNFDRHEDPQVPRQLQAATTAATDAGGQAVLLELEQELLADLHHIPLWTRVHEVFHNDRVGDVRLDGQGLLQLNRIVVRS